MLLVLLCSSEIMDKCVVCGIVTVASRDSRRRNISSSLNGTGPFFRLFRDLFTHILEEYKEKGKPEYAYVCSKCYLCLSKAINRLTALEESIEEIKNLCLSSGVSSSIVNPVILPGRLCSEARDSSMIGSAISPMLSSNSEYSHSLMHTLH